MFNKQKSKTIYGVSNFDPHQVSSWKTSYNEVIFAVDFFLLIESKHWYTDVGRNEWTARLIILKNKSRLVTFHENS